MLVAAHVGRKIFHLCEPMAGKWLSELACPDRTPVPGIASPAPSDRDKLVYLMTFCTSCLAIYRTLLSTQMLFYQGAGWNPLQLSSVASFFLLEGTLTPWGPLNPLLVAPHSAQVVCAACGSPAVSGRAYQNELWP